MKKAILMLRIVCLLLIVPLLAIRPRAAQSSAALSLCNVRTDAQASDGKMFTIRALYAHTFHGAEVTDDACRSVKINVTLVPGYKLSKSTLKRLNELTRNGHKALIAFRAIFRVAQQEQCFGQNCELFQVEISEIISAGKEDPPVGEGLSHESAGLAAPTS